MGGDERRVAQLVKRDALIRAGAAQHIARRSTGRCLLECGPRLRHTASLPRCELPLKRPQCQFEHLLSPPRDKPPRVTACTRFARKTASPADAVQLLGHSHPRAGDTSASSTRKVHSTAAPVAL
jgi:hypothetical protein